MSTIVRSRAELDAKLAALPPPAAGFVRTFRGQTQRYPKLLSTRHRAPRGKRDRAWGVYAHLLARRIGQVPAGTSEEGYATLDDVLYWFEAIKQHYGPGSPFIDVTHSVDVALWFALHQSRWIETQNFVGPGTRAGVDLFPVARRWLAYQPITETGWFYVLDVPQRADSLSLSHGAFVDLRQEAPAAFGSSTRIQAQHACLVLGDDAVNGGDLSNFLVCAPMEVAVAVAEDAAWLGDMHALFPPPEQDPWYARFLDMPHSWDLDGDGSLQSFLAPPLDITLYAPNGAPTEEEMRQARARFYVLPSPLVLNYLLANDAAPAELKDAIGVILEGPILLATPPLDTGQWNEEALWKGVAQTAPIHDRTTGVELASIPLDNVLFEFSPLERADWDRFGSDETMELMRGVWLRRQGAGFEVWLVQQQGHEPEVMGGFHVIYDAEKQGIGVCKPGEATARVLLREMEAFGKEIMHALLVLHHVNPDRKIAPLPLMTVDGSRHLAVVQGAVAKLERAAVPCVGAAYLRIRNVNDGSLYLGGGNTAEQVERISTLR